MTIEIVLLAMVAAFLGLRLYSVLGKRTGHEQEPTVRRPEPGAPSPEQREPHVPDMAPARVPEAPATIYDASAEAGVQRILSADRSFDAGQFMDGAKAAYGMILEAFWRGDRDELRDLCDADVYESFVAAIDAREERGEVLDNRLVRIEDARIAKAELDGSLARISVRFDADIAAVVKDRDGALIGGSLSDAVETHDVWTFTRDVKSDSPAWILDETDDA